MPPALSIFKQPHRYSESDRPAPGERCFFSHALRLTSTEYVSFPRSFERKELFQNAFVTVQKNRPHLVEALFDGADASDLISPEFLLSMELTAFGHELVDAVGMPAATSLSGAM